MLSDPVQRMIYDEIHGYALTAINPFLDDSSPKDHVFVDEFSCIGMFTFSRPCPRNLILHCSQGTSMTIYETIYALQTFIYWFIYMRGVYE